MGVGGGGGGTHNYQPLHLVLLSRALTLNVNSYSFESGLQGTFGQDCLMHWCCPMCAYAQEARVGYV